LFTTIWKLQVQCNGKFFTSSSSTKLYLSHKDIECRGSEVGTFAAEIRAGDDAERLLLGLEVNLVRNEVDAVHLHVKESEGKILLRMIS